MTSLPKIMFYMLVAGFLLVANKTYYAQNNLEFILFEEVFSWQYKGAFIGNLLISIVSILSFILYRKYFPGYVSICYIALIIFVFKASINDLGDIVKTPNSFYSLKGIGNYVNIGIIFFAASPVFFKKILKLFYYLCFVFLVAGIINLGKLGLGSGRSQYLFAIREFTVYLIWVFPFFLLQEEENKKKNIINFAVFLVLFLFVLATGARSYLLIYISYFLVKFKNQLRKKNSILIILGIGLLVILSFFLLSNSGFGEKMESAVTNLTERKSDDTRSSQISEFWDQYDFDHLIEGVGPKATWYWTATGPYFGLDNQFLLISWWAGLPTLLFYVFFLVRSFFQKSQILLFENIKGTRLIIGWWIFACMGFAIYISLSSELYYYFVTLIMGLHLCRFTMIKTEEDIEEA